jgi:hypothetical protein
LPGYHRAVKVLRVATWAPLILVACAATGGGNRQVPSPSPTATDSTSALDPGDVPAAVFNKIVADAVAQTGVDPSAITVKESRSVTWSDGSLGCPQPGMVYTQVLVDGFRVVLIANGKQLDYHGTGDRFVLCPVDRSKEPVG